MITKTTKRFGFRTRVIESGLLLAACLLISEKASAQQKLVDPVAGSAIFPKGQQGPASNFTGKAYNFGLVAQDSTFTTLVGNVYFEPGARTNWHTHGGGQILIITAGKGYHQIKGQPRQTLKQGDVVKCPPNTEHWHGAGPDMGMQQMYIVPNTEKGIVNWLGPVTDQEYNDLK